MTGIEYLGFPSHKTVLYSPYLCWLIEYSLPASLRVAVRHFQCRHDTACISLRVGLQLRQLAGDLRRDFPSDRSLI